MRVSKTLSLSLMVFLRGEMLMSDCVSCIGSTKIKEGKFCWKSI